MAMPVTRYTKSGDVHVAYQVFGGGSVDLVFVPGFVSNIENYWEHPELARWLLRVGSFARVIMFDKRGTGLSDPVSEAPSLDLRMDDVRAVMDAVEIERAALLGISEGGPLATLFAATYPQRCRGLVLYGSFARSSWITPRDLRLTLHTSIAPGEAAAIWRCGHRRTKTIRPCSNGGAASSGLALARRLPSRSCG